MRETHTERQTERKRSGRESIGPVSICKVLTMNHNQKSNTVTHTQSQNI